MKSRWTDRGASEAVDRWGHLHGEGFALRIYTARLIGADPVLVLHGGGNVSWKSEYVTPLGDSTDAIFVKRSGADLTDLQPEDLTALEIDKVITLGAKGNLTDAIFMNELRRTRFDTAAPTPSIETLVHAALPHAFVDHSHADAILAITNRPNGERLIRDAVGNALGHGVTNEVAILPYIRPGLELGQAVARCIAESPKATGIVLLKHGLITFANDAQTSYEKHIALVEACERFIARKSGTSRPTVVAAPSTPSNRLAATVAPILRGALAVPTGDEDRPHRPMMMEWRGSADLIEFLESAEAESVAGSGPLTGDHVIRTKPWPMLLAKTSQGDEADFRTNLAHSLGAFEKRYREYAGSDAEHNGVDWRPPVVLIPGAGLFALGPTKKEAIIVADIAEHTIQTKLRSRHLGPFEPLSDEHLRDVEFRLCQRAKLNHPVDNSPLLGHVVVISGGAGAIGSAIAVCCIEAGAYVALTDIDANRASISAERIEERHGVNTCLSLEMDVTNEASVRDGYEEIARRCGGVDVIVPNAGIAHVAPIDELSATDFRRVMEVNAVGYLLFMREGVRILKRQGIGGHVIINASKNVFGPGKDFGAYSASKAAGHQLGKVAALELAEFGIRVNMINADAVFGDDETPSGLWATVGPDRARSRNLDPSQLEDYYRKRTLLKTRVLGRHVGRAVVFFASNATPTTGATLPVDGGVPEAFPR